MDKNRVALFLLCLFLGATPACGLASKSASPVPIPTATPAPTPSAADLAGVTIWYVIGTPAPIHACPTEECEALTTLAFGTRLVVVETVEGWQRIRLPAGTYGWIRAELTSESAVCGSCE